MAACGFQSVAWIDEGLFCEALLGAELQDWCALQQASRWSKEAVDLALPLLKEERAASSDAAEVDQEVFECCAKGDVTGFWARVEPGEEIFKNGELRVEYTIEDSLLHVAAREFRRETVGEKNRRMFRWLMSRKGAESVVQYQNKRGQNALHICARNGHGREVAAARFLQMHQAGKDVKDNYESTPLLDAVREEHPEMVRLLVDHSADVNAFMPNCHGHGETPLILAVRLKNVEITKILVDAEDIDLHQKSMEDVPFASEALDFAPPGGALHKILEDAIDKQEQAAFSRKCSGILEHHCSPQEQIVTDVLHHAHWPGPEDFERQMSRQVTKHPDADKTAAAFLAVLAARICGVIGV